MSCWASVGPETTMLGDDLATAKILIVDDEPTNVRLLERMLSGAGYDKVVATTDARMAQELYRREQPDLVLLDLMMPHLDGIAVLGQLRADTPQNTYVPVLVLTADAGVAAKRKALAAGAHDFLTKPFENFEVLLRIRNLLGTRRLYTALERHNRSLAEIVEERTARLLQSEKVAAMGSLLAGVAHELNNPLTVLSAQAQLLLTQQGPPVFLRGAQRIHAAAERSVRIVRNFLALARQRPPERGEMSLKLVAEGSLELLAYELRVDDVEVVVDLPDDLPILWADRHQFHQVFVNLLTNAHHAMRPQDTLRRITVTAHHDRAADRVDLRLADTGPGMAPEIQARIFEPFFTTKPAGEGTGLGLSLCRAIVEEHGGTITVESGRPGRGTTFVISLPVATPFPAPAAPANIPTSPARRSRILIVDDEPDVADVLAEAIAGQGHEADIAAHGVMALEMLARGPYDAVVSDTKMPGLDGEGFYAALARSFPRLRERIIFLTGDVLSREKREFLERCGAPFLTKPCDLRELHRLLEEVLLRAEGMSPEG